MQKIKLLSQKEILKIAAGQVVDRPANVVKELVENSIDAGATQITVYIEDGGKNLIRVVDNGCGMSKEDAKFCFIKHSTSKITSLDQLSNFSCDTGTFGFRGEALASISAVSKISLTTKEANIANIKNSNYKNLESENNQPVSQDSQDYQNGICLELENGEFTSELEIPCDNGTDLKIKNLFYNTPARQKFLKKSESETRNIIQLMQAFCLDYLHINFRVFVDGKQTLICPPTDDIIKRAAQIWDHNFSKNLLLLSNTIKSELLEEISHNNKITPEYITDPETGEVLENNARKNNARKNNTGENNTREKNIGKKNKIYGAITNHQYYRYDRGNIFLFVNKRWVKNSEIQSALIKGFNNVLPAGKYPAAFIFIEIDAAEVDINYHPRKEEVKILHPRIITNKLQELVRVALQEHLSSQIKQNTNFNRATHNNAYENTRNYTNFGDNNYENTLNYKNFDNNGYENTNNYTNFGEKTYNQNYRESVDFKEAHFNAIRNATKDQNQNPSQNPDVSANSNLNQNLNTQNFNNQDLNTQNFNPLSCDTKSFNTRSFSSQNFNAQNFDNTTFNFDADPFESEITVSQELDKFKKTPELQEFFEVQGSPESQEFIETQRSPKSQEFIGVQKTPESKEFIGVQESIDMHQTYNIVGQYHKTYILIEKEDGLFFVDQHAAHERILYEIFSKRFEDVAKIQLLFPQLITLKEEDIELLEPNLDIFEQNGIEMEIFGQTQIKIQATPVHIKNIDIKELIYEIIGWIKEFNNLDSKDFFKKVNEKLHAQMACKAAVKAGDTLTNEQMEKLLQDLEVTENRFACPHGRPTGWILTLDEIEKKFRRKV